MTTSGNGSTTVNVQAPKKRIGLITIVIIVGLVAWVAWALFAKTDAEKRADTEGARADSLAVEVETNEALLEELVSVNDRLREEFERTQDSLGAVEEAARLDAERWARSNSDAMDRLDELVTGNSELEAVVADVRESYAGEIEALSRQVSALEATNAILFRRVQVSDSALVEAMAVNELLHTQVEALERQADLLNVALRPSLKDKMWDALPVIAGTIIVMAAIR